MSGIKEDFQAGARKLAEELINYSLDTGKKAGITDVKVEIGNSSEKSLNVEDREVTESKSGEETSAAMSLYAGDRLLTFSSNNISPGALKNTIEQNIAVIHLVPEIPSRCLLEPEKLYKGPVPDLDLHDKNPPGQDELISCAKAAYDIAIQQPGVVLCETGFTSGVSQSLLIATNGLVQNRLKTIYQCYAMVTVQGNNEKQVEVEFTAARHFCDLQDPEEIGLFASIKANEKLNAITPETGNYSIVMTPEASRTFFASVISAIDGSSVYRGETFLKDKIGQQVMAKGITIESDPLVIRGLSSSAVDSSGMESHKLNFIENGILLRYNVDLREARLLNIEPIGRNNGPSNVRVLPGTLSKQEILRGIKKGIYIQEFSGGTANVQNGIFSRPASGKLIENSRVTNKVLSNFAVSGNLKEMFMKALVAKDTPTFPVEGMSFAAPTTRIDGMMISGL
jgi:PmbA protein